MSRSQQNIFTIKYNRLYKKHIFSPLQYFINPKEKYFIYILASIYGLFKAVHIKNKHSLISDYDNMNKRAIERYRKDNIKYCLSIDSSIKQIKERRNNIIKDDRKLTFYEKNRYLIRKNHYNKKLFFNDYISRVIAIQKHIRGYLSRIVFNALVNLMIIQQSLKYIIYIQKCYRGHYVYKNFRENIIIFHILKQRESNWRKLQPLFIHYFYRNKKKREIIAKRILEWELPYIIKIQNSYKTHYLSNLAKEIIPYEQRNYVLTYPFECKDVKLRIYRYTSMSSLTSFDRSTMISLNDENYDVFSFEMCPLRKYHVLYIRHDNLIPGLYKCQFIVDGFVVCDGRFPIFENETDTFYNIIKFEIKNRNGNNIYVYNKYIDSI